MELAAVGDAPRTARPSEVLCIRCGLTFDMRGGRQQAKPDVGRPLDGRVRARLRSAHAASRCALTQPLNTDKPSSASELVFALHALAVTPLDGLIEQPIVPLLRATSVRT